MYITFSSFMQNWEPETKTGTIHVMQWKDPEANEVVVVVAVVVVVVVVVVGDTM